MTQSLIWCLALLINVPSRLSSGAELDTRSVCQGDAVQLFRNVPFNNGSLVSIYINGDSQTMIGTGNSLSTFSFMQEYKKKMFFDQLDNFWIQKIQRSDEQKYVLRTQIDAKTTKYEAQISVMVPPTKHCRPKLLKIDSALIASLESNECGYPSASVKWVEYPGISYMDKSMVKLPSGGGSGTYYACVESPALKCVSDLKLSDYCSSYVVEANNSPAVSPCSPCSSPISSELIGIIVIITIVIVICIVMIAYLVLRNKRKRDSDAVPREKVLRDILARNKQGKYWPARENNVENGLMMMNAVSNVEIKQVQCNESKGPAALMQTKIKNKMQRLVDGSRKKQGLIDGTGGVIIPLLTFRDFEDFDY